MTASALMMAGAASAADTPATFRSPDGNFSIDALEALGRVSAPAVSPDAKTVLFGISFEDLEANSSNNDLYTLALDTSPTHPRAKAVLYGLTAEDALHSSIPTPTATLRCGL